LARAPLEGSARLDETEVRNVLLGQTGRRRSRVGRFHPEREESERRRRLRFLAAGASVRPRDNHGHCPRQPSRMFRKKYFAGIAAKHRGGRHHRQKVSGSSARISVVELLPETMEPSFPVGGGQLPHGGRLRQGQNRRGCQEVEGQSQVGR